jgi:hypothetical protein
VTVRALPERGYKVKVWTGTDDDASTSSINYVTMDSDKDVTLEFDFAHNRTLIVPGDGENRYLDLQSAIDAARDGDIIILNKGIWPWGGFYITDKVIMITSTNPDDPAVVAQTVIDCSAYYDYWWWGGSGGFYFGPDSGSSVLDGITITGARGGYGGYGMDFSTSDVNAAAYDPYYFATHYSHGGGAIYIAQGTSPIIANCVILNSAIYGGSGGSYDDAAEGFNGYPGVNGGSAFGGAIYVGARSSPTITHCRISGCSAIGGDGGPGQNGGGWTDTMLRSGDGGRGGWPGQGYGGGIYCASESTPTITACRIENCQAIGGDGGDGGSGGWGGHGGGWSTSGEWDYWYYTSGTYPYYDPYVYSYYPSYWYWYTQERFYYVEGELWQHWGYMEGPWYYSGHGGGIYVASGSKPTIVDCIISGNTADGGVNGLGGGGGGGRPLNRWDIPGLGGAIYCADGSQAEFDNCQIVNNTVVGAAEALIIDPNDPNAIDPNTYLQIPYSGYGGGVCLRDTLETTIDNCYIGNNQVRSGFGGAIYSVNADFIMTGTDIVGNFAKKGGGLASVDGWFEMTDCSVRPKRGTRGGRGRRYVSLRLRRTHCRHHHHG